ncbi:gluconokinase [Marinobacter arenosus]|uniref:gluconokinase n=1 Tax=Marinobacter arenosus TaxID=2856822 RepID=UPI001C4CBAB7|nr:gluconokinase [Marinobacter arenosus]MBW0147721.1 gluconokinase [Marinobacter arenosus]
MSVRKVIVMGVSGCGKSLIGTGLAQRLEVPFFDADDFHSRANVAKMANGVPLTDADRIGWLDDLAELVRSEPQGLVLACSALKRAYRDRLRAGNPTLEFVYLKGDMDTIWARHASREDHYFTGRAMLESQFDTLQEPEPDEGVIEADVADPPDRIIERCLYRLGERRSGAAET